jgi:uncharacterized membrane protein YwaF
MKIFAKLGEYKPCGMFTIGHMVLLSITIIGIVIALYFTKNKTKEEVRKIIKNCTIFLWILEIIKIVFNLLTGNAGNPNSYIPLYFCSLILYAGIFSAFFEGTLKRVGDVFLATGGIVAGISFLLVPMTSLTNYPVFHYISIQSFTLHGIMVYIGILVNVTHYVEYSKEDFKYYFGLIIVIGVFAYLVNLKLNTNFMFISQNYPGTPMELIYNTTGKLFPVVMLLGQAILPFYIIEFLKTKLQKQK